MCLRVQVVYRCGCNATRAQSDQPDSTSELWSCHEYVPSCAGPWPVDLPFFYVMANDCGRPTCAAVRNYWSWLVHSKLSERQDWDSFVQQYASWYLAGANDQDPSSTAYIPHLYERDLAGHILHSNYPHSSYPRYDHPGFRFSSAHPLLKTEDQTPPPWPVLDASNEALSSGCRDYYPALDKRILAEDLVYPADGPHRLTLAQVHFMSSTSLKMVGRSRG